MFDQSVGQINTILSFTIGGLSISTIIAMVIVVIKVIISFRRENKLTKTHIEKAFQEAVLPSNIKIDLSKKIEEPLANGIQEMKNMLKSTLQHVVKGELLILAILNEFSHVHKLPESTQQEIAEYIDERKSITVALEG